MNKFLTAFFVLIVACATSLAYAQAQAPQAQAPQSAASASAGSPAVPGGAKSIDTKVAMCIGCHGIKGYQASFPEVHKVPMISGQSAKYIVSALNAYKAGDRKHPTMRGIAEGLSEQDTNDIAAYYEAHGKGEGNVPADKASRQPSEQVLSLIHRDKDNACIRCHGANFSTPAAGTVPKIAGQHADYMFAALKAYKTENNPGVGRSNGVMAGVAKKYSNAELKALAGYVSSLDGELKTKPENKFR